MLLWCLLLHEHWYGCRVCLVVSLTYISCVQCIYTATQHLHNPRSARWIQPPLQGADSSYTSNQRSLNSLSCGQTYNLLILPTYILRKYWPFYYGFYWSFYSTWLLPEKMVETTQLQYVRSCWCTSVQYVTVVYSSPLVGLDRDELNVLSETGARLSPS